MMRFFQKATYSILLALLAGGGAFAQNPQNQPKPPEEKAVVSVQVVLSRYEGDKKTSSLPFTLLATSDRSRVSVRTGAQIPIVTAAFSSGDGKNADAKQPAQTFQYMDIGTNVDCTVHPPENGRFRVEVNVSDRSVLERNSPGIRGAPPVASGPTTRNFSYSNSVLLRDGETRQFVAASDKVSGDVIRIDVSLKVEN
jgi:hypothetical protein